MKGKDSESKKSEEKIDPNCIFAKENINMGRQPEFDYYKALLLWILIIYHIYLGFLPGYLFTLLKNIVVILSAASFMFQMGVGMKYSRHHELKDYISRGVVLLTLAQFFYLIRETFPNLIAWWITGEQKYISNSLLVIQTDILTFAGWAFFFLAFLKKMKLTDFQILIVGIIMNFAAYPLFLIMKLPSSYVLNQFLGYFVLTKADAYFPLIGYFVFVAFGNWMGGFYQRMANKDKFYNYVLIFLLPIVAIYHYIRNYYTIPFLPELYSVEHYCLSPGPDAIVRCMASLVFLAGFYKLHKIFGKVPYFISHCGKNLNQYYILSGVFTMHTHIFLRLTKGPEFLNNFKYSDLLAVMFLFSSWALIELNDKYIHFTITTLKNPMRKIVFSLIWIISFICLICIYPKVEVYANIWNDYLNDS